MRHHLVRQRLESGHVDGGGSIPVVIVGQVQVQLFRRAEIGLRFGRVRQRHRHRNVKVIAGSDGRPEEGKQEEGD